MQALPGARRPRRRLRGGGHRFDGQLLLSVDFELLTETEREVITTIAERTAASSKTIQLDLPLDSPSLVGSLHRLENLGFIRRNDERRFFLVNYFFRRWLHNLPLTRPLSGGRLSGGRLSGAKRPGGAPPQREGG